MTQISVTVEKYIDSDKKHTTYNPPVIKTISVGANYTVSSWGLKTIIYDAITTSQYWVSETKAEVDLLLSASIDVAVQDQHTPVVVASFNNVHASTTLATDGAIDDYDIVVTSAVGAAVGNYLIMFEPDHTVFYFGTILAIVSTTITLDTPLDHGFEAGTFIDYTTTNMNVDGSTTPVVFGLRGTGVVPGVDLSTDVTRLIFGCTTATPVDLSTFGDLPALTNGIVLRTRDGVYKNILNVKTNGGLAVVAGGDWTPYVATNPNQGQNGFVARMTFAGQNKMGVTVRLPVGEDLEIIIQDDLTGLTRFEVVAEGHIVEGN